MFRDVLSYETWQTLTPGEKAHLQVFHAKQLNWFFIDCYFYIPLHNFPFE